ncbi:hypothetical protein K7432_010878 [Basidiobolus ranarum]|uniref:Uncharacterized protein n=1 Tax=Basidiobolus ranarum TaxID=34480 RepID=A0ABR2VUT0_9FUNG
MNNPYSSQRLCAACLNQESCSHRSPQVQPNPCNATPHFSQSERDAMVELFFAGHSHVANTNSSSQQQKLPL